MLTTKESRAELRRLTMVWCPSADTVRELADAVPLLLEDVEELLETVAMLERAAGERAPRGSDDAAMPPRTHHCGGAVAYRIQGEECRCCKCGELWPADW